MRRKFPAKKIDPNAPVIPPVPGSGASLPPRPKNLNDAAEKLAKELGVSVAAGYGFGDKDKKDPAWRLFAFSLDAAVKVPTEFDGFPVSRRAMPTISPAWGKAAHRFTKAV